MEEVKEILKLFVNGAECFNKDTGLSFIADTNAIVSYSGEMSGVKILSYLYSSYNYYHCWIQGDITLPEEIVRYADANGFFKAPDGLTMDKKLDIRSNQSTILEAYKEFKVIVQEMVSAF